MSVRIYNILMQVVAVPHDPLAEAPIRLQRVHPVARLSIEHRGHGARVGAVVRVRLRDCHCKAAAIHVIALGAEDAQAAALHHPLDLPQRVIFHMLVADRVVGVRREHRRQVALLEVPHAVIRQDLRDLRDE